MSARGAGMQGMGGGSEYGSAALAITRSHGWMPIFCAEAARLVQVQRSQNAILLDGQLNGPRRPFRRNGHFHPKLFAPIAQRGIGDVFGEVVILRRAES